MSYFDVRWEIEREYDGLGKKEVSYESRRIRFFFLFWFGNCIVFIN